MSESGHISIHAENILPIIKKWLYSEKDIFLRELVANASDAIQKLAKISLVDSFLKEVPEARIDILLNKDAKTLTIKDTGVGLTADEVKKYINQVVFSGVTDFVEKYQGKDADEQIIGHFGLGFYSAFMAADKVEIHSLSYQDGAEAVHWSCDGSTEYELSPGQKADVGTEIVLHLSEDSVDFLNDYVVREVLERHCMFIRYPIFLADKQVNDPAPLWTKSASQITDKQYTDFFHKLFPGSPDPLFWIHLNLDYPFKLKGILYFPKISHEMDAANGLVKLYCNQVFVGDNKKELVPEFLTLLKGALDCPDLPLNVSRSYLQNDPVAKKISEHIIKKVADKLVGMEKTDREQYERFWPEIHQFIKYGMLREREFYDKMIDHILFEDAAAGGFYTIQQYLDKFGEKTDKKIVYCSDEQTQAAYIHMFKSAEIGVALCSSMIDAHFLPYVEMLKGKDLKFVRVDGDVTSMLSDSGTKSKIIDPHDQKNEDEKIADIFRKFVRNPKVKIKVENLKAGSAPAILSFDENMRRMKEFASMNGRQEVMKLTDDDHTLIVNSNNSAIKRLVELSRGIERDQDLRLMVNQIYDLAYLQHGRFDANMMTEFLSRSSELLGRFGV